METVNYILKNYVNNTDTNVEGVKLYCLINDLLEKKMVFILEIESDMSLTSSFLNSSFGNIIDNYGYDLLKNYLKIKSNKSQFEKISKYLHNYKELFKN